MESSVTTSRQRDAALRKLKRDAAETLQASLNRLVDIGHKPTARAIENVLGLGLVWTGERFEVAP